MWDANVELVAFFFLTRLGLLEGGCERLFMAFCFFLGGGGRLTDEWEFDI